MFRHIFLNQFKIILRNKETLFWVLTFPIILGFLFNMAFSNLNSAYIFNPINIAVVDDVQYQKHEKIVTSIELLSKNGDSQIFKTNFVDDKNQAEELLKNNTIDGYIEVKDGTPIVIVKNSGTNQTIIKAALDQTLEMNNSVIESINYNPSILQTGALSNIDDKNDYMNDTTNSSVDRTVLYFYSLIGMACLYAGIFGIMAVNQNEANLSTLGARLGVSPANRFTTLTANLMAGFMVSYAGSILLYLFLTQILNINFGNNSWTILFVMMFGCLAGILLGMFIGACNKKSESIKTGILISTTMLFSFLAGMMGTSVIKHLVDVNMPILAFINPVNLISDALFSTYYFGVSQRYWMDIIGLSMFVVATTFLSWLFLRKKKYANL